MVFYMVLVTISIIFDSITFAELPAFDHMTQGEQYGSTLWITVWRPMPSISHGTPALDSGGPLF